MFFSSEANEKNDWGQSDRMSWKANRRRRRLRGEME